MELEPVSEETQTPLSTSPPSVGMGTNDNSHKLHASGDYPGSIDVNRITMELLVPKTKYKRHLALCDPKQLEKTQQKEQQRLRHRAEIQTLTRQLMDQAMGKQSLTNTEMAVSKQIQDLFDAYMDACSTHFENRAQMMEPREDWKDEREEEQEEVMFAHCVSPHPVKVPVSERPKMTTPYYGMNMFMKRR